MPCAGSFTRTMLAGADSPRAAKGHDDALIVCSGRDRRRAFGRRIRPGADLFDDAEHAHAHDEGVAAHDPSVEDETPSTPSVVVPLSGRLTVSAVPKTPFWASEIEPASPDSIAAFSLAVGVTLGGIAKRSSSDWIVFVRV